jgi:hypothetical protein
MTLLLTYFLIFYISLVSNAYLVVFFINLKIETLIRLVNGHILRRGGLGGLLEEILGAFWIFLLGMSQAPFDPSPPLILRILGKLANAEYGRVIILLIYIKIQILS